MKAYDFYYSPKDIVINQNDTVKWVWIDDFHDTRAGLPPDQPPVPYDGAFESPVENKGYVFSVTFNRDFLVRYPASGNRYDYICTPHWAEGMVGSITVVRTPQQFEAKPVAWQEVPATASTATADCTGTLSADETTLDISCTHNVANVTGAHIHSGYIGDNGAIFCNLGTGNPLTATCPGITQDQANQLWDGGFYVNIHSNTYPDGEIRGQIVRAGGKAKITGKVLRSDGLPVGGAVVSDGTRSTTTNDSGEYTLSNVPGGIYRLTATSTGYIITANTGVNPVVVNGNNPTNKSFTGTVPAGCSGDNDGDGRCNEDEVRDGSNPDDSGSIKAVFTSPVYVLWNGFIGLRNILELVNKGTEALAIELVLFDINGAEVTRMINSIGSQSELDIIVNDLPGFAANSYGILAINFPTQLSSAIDGRMFYYREALTPGEFEFAFGVPFTPATYGPSAVIFNTIQPSRNPVEAALLVTQWLSIVNLDQSRAREFEVERYAQNGELLSTTQVTVSPFGRVDLDGGHISPGPGYVGLNRIVPRNSQVPYIAQLYRYGTNGAPGEISDKYHFAFPLLARPGNGELQFAPISTGSGGENWIELANVSDESVEVNLQLFDHNGTRLHRVITTLEPYAQEHVNAGSFLLPGASGIARVAPSVNGSLIGMSMFYFRDSTTGSITSMYGTPLQESFGTTIVGSYNLFLEMYNWLKIMNTSSSPIEVMVTVYGNRSFPDITLLDLDPLTTTILGLHESSAYGTTPNSYGIVELESETPGALLSELLRVRPSATAIVDYTAPTPVR